MGFDVSAKGLVVREKGSGPVTTGTIICERCGATNMRSSTRCRACLATLSIGTPKAAPPRPVSRTTTPVVHPRFDVDQIFAELEEFTHEEAPAEVPAVRFQCPVCARIVDQAATRCQCGAIFEEKRDIVGYECPLCGARVASDATLCRCGARFA